VRHDLTGRASVGAFYFGRETTGSNSFNRVAGMDLRVAPKPVLEFEAFAMRSATSGEADDWAGRTGFRLDTNKQRGRLGLIHIGESFRNDLGFTPRRGIATLFGSYERVLRPANTRALVREQSIGVKLDSTSDDRYSQSLTRVGGFTYQLQMRDGATVDATATNTFEQLEAPFNVGRNLRIVPGEYTYNNFTIDYRSNQSAWLSGNLGIEAGEFWTGTQRIASTGVRVRMNEHVATSASLARTNIDLPQGTFAANLARFRLDWSFSPRLFLNAFVQYNGEADTWLSNIRFNFVHHPLSDIYVVWNETRLPTEVRRALMLKYTHLITF
jgi:hypothetical protein